MLSAHFWMGTGVTLGAAAVMGLGLGSFVTSPQAPARSASATIDTTVDDQTMEEARFTADKGPGAIHCTGCGPTLADRRWHADMAAIDAADGVESGGDPMADHVSGMTPERALSDQSQSIEPLTPQVARLVAGETTPPSNISAPVVMTRGGMDDAPPPAMVATAAAPFRP